MPIESLSALMRAGESRDLFDIVIDSDCIDRGATREESFEKMRGMYLAIRRAKEGYDPSLRSQSGMVGGEGAKMREYLKTGKTISGDYAAKVIAQALEMGESNACMKCIVAAPTAGSCGVLPAALLPYQERENLSDDDMVRALYIAGAIGQVVAKKASIAGAAGGCQAEIGTASAMAAGALIAMSSADKALAGIRSAVPPDEVIDAMRDVGDKMDVSLRETGIGGVAGTTFGQMISEKMSGAK